MDRIADQWMRNSIQMTTNLMEAPGLGAQFKPAVPPGGVLLPNRVGQFDPVKGPEVGESLDEFPRGVRLQGEIDLSFGLKPTPSNPLIGFTNLTEPKLLIELGGGFRIQGKEQNPARPRIQTMHGINPGFEMITQSIKKDPFLGDPKTRVLGGVDMIPGVFVEGNPGRRLLQDPHGRILAATDIRLKQKKRT